MIMFLLDNKHNYLIDFKYELNINFFINNIR